MECLSLGLDSNQSKGANGMNLTKSPSIQAPNQSLRSPAAAECDSVSVAFPVTMMLAGLLGNALALALVCKSYRGKENKRKRSFLMMLGALALTDLTGKLLTTPVVISVYLANRDWGSVDPSGKLCAFFGVCMTAFGLCPLFLASAMAVERALAVHAPHWYANHICCRLTRLVVAAIWVAVGLFSSLPAAGVGRYSLQWPGTWCFIDPGSRALADTVFASAFTVLGIASLLLTFACNAATIGGLVARCRRPQVTSSSRHWERIATETLVQLTGITCVLGVCWTPLLIQMVRMIYTESSLLNCYPSPGDQERGDVDPGLRGECNFMLIAIRLASLNQILDPWMYLLLRQILLRKVCLVANALTHCSVEGCKKIPVTAEARAHLTPPPVKDTG